MYLIPPRYERWIFACVAIVTLYPIVLNQYFTSGDGPAHLYNARLTLDLLKGDSFVKTFHQFNSFPVPNWISNVILTPLCAIMPAYLAEKLMLIAYCLLLPYSFRYLITALKGNPLSSYFIFPFVFSFMFQLGFYNFSIAIIVLFFSLGYYFKHQKTLRLIHYIVLCLLAIITYFSHIFVAFMLTAVLQGAQIRLMLETLNLQELSISSFKFILRLTLALLPALGLIAAFFIFRPESSQHVYLSNTELLHDIVHIRPIYNSQLEKLFSLGYFILLVAYFLFVLFKKKTEQTSKTFYSHITSPEAFWLWNCAGLLMLYFTSPDGDGWAGYVAVRTLFLLFIFFIVWLSTKAVSQKALYALVALGLILHVGLLGKKNGFIKRNQYRFTELTEISSSINPGKTLVPIIMSGDWNIGHLSNYVGCERNVVILENYEAATGYFPIAWKSDAPTAIVGTIRTMKVPNDWKSGDGKSSIPADYVLLIGKSDATPDSGFKDLFEQLNQSYYLQKETNFFSLYHLK